MNVEYKFGNNLKVSKVQEFPETLALYELEANQFIVEGSQKIFRVHQSHTLGYKFQTSLSPTCIMAENSYREVQQNLSLF